MTLELGKLRIINYEKTVPGEFCSQLPPNPLYDTVMLTRHSIYMYTVG